jgi:hypothetical protein
MYMSEFVKDAFNIKDKKNRKYLTMKEVIKLLLDREQFIKSNFEKDSNRAFDTKSENQKNSENSDNFEKSSKRDKSENRKTKDKSICNHCIYNYIIEMC